MKPRLPSHPTTQVAAFILGCLLCLPPLQAQSAGTIQGRVYNLNSEEFTWSNTYGPGARPEAKARPNFGFEYSDVFANQRFGFVASANHVSSYTEAYRRNLTYSFPEPRPQLLNQERLPLGPFVRPLSPEP